MRIVWFADENFGGDRKALEELLALLIEADLGLSLNVNMTAAGLVANAELLSQMKAGGVDYVVLGVESLEDPACLDAGRAARCAGRNRGVCTGDPVLASRSALLSSRRTRLYACRALA